MTSFPRASGILLHPTSLPGRYGIGSLGPEAYQFIDFLKETGQQLWQVLPLGPTGHGNSPYLCYSSMAGNPLLISLEQLCDRHLLSYEEIQPLAELPADCVDFDRVMELKLPLLETAAERFMQSASDEDREEFKVFADKCDFWLDGYSFYMALKKAHGGASWTDWDPAIARREPEAMQEWRHKVGEQIHRHKVLQFEFHRQWGSLKQYANDRHIQIIGDIPIYVAHDSADVWAYPDNFMVDLETFAPSQMAGVPPDYFSETGQLWGNPTYNWEVLQERNFHWWLQRLRAILDYVDLIRVDHFRGFQAFWAVDEGETTAMNGRWVEAPGEALFKTVKQELGTLPILAEDLGLITPEVEELRDKFGFPGMKILQFAFGDTNHNPYLPFSYERNCVVYTGTHDNDTTVGWFEKADDYTRGRVERYLGCFSDDGIHWDMIRMALTSIADLAIIPLQDLLGLGSEDRMNSPGKAEGNWGWRYSSDVLNNDLREKFRELVRLTNRVPAHWE